MGRLGKPLYTYGDVVLFHMPQVKNWDGEVVSEAEDIEGVVEIVDPYGTSEQNKEPSYDIFLKERNLLVKHVVESQVVKKIRVAAPNERLD